MEYGFSLTEQSDSLMDDNLDIYQGEIKTKINEEEKMYLKERILDFEDIAASRRTPGPLGAVMWRKQHVDL